MITRGGRGALDGRRIVDMVGGCLRPYIACAQLKSEVGFASNHWFSSNRGWVSLQTIGLTQIGGRFRSKPLVWLKSGVGFASNHWFDPNRRSVSLQTIGLAQIGGRFGFKPLVWPKLRCLREGVCNTPLHVPGLIHRRPQKPHFGLRKPPTYLCPRQKKEQQTA